MCRCCWGRGVIRRIGGVEAMSCGWSKLERIIGEVGRVGVPLSYLVVRICWLGHGESTVWALLRAFDIFTDRTQMIKKDSASGLNRWPAFHLPPPTSFHASIIRSPRPTRQAQLHSAHLI